MIKKKSFINIEEPIYNLVSKHKEIDILSAIVLSDIDYFNKGNGYFKKNETISDELNISVATVSRKINSLIELGYIETKQVLRGRKIITTLKFKEYITSELDCVQPNQNDKQPNQNDKQPNQNDEVEPNQIDKVHIRTTTIDKELDKELELNALSESLRLILKKYYGNSISIKFGTKNVNDKLKSKLKKYSYDEIKTGYENYLITMANEKRELTYIKSCETFLNQETFNDYQVIENVKSKSLDQMTMQEKYERLGGQ